jgi:hypothetical protein
LILSPSTIKGFLSVDEQALWKDPEDYEYTFRLIEVTAPMTRNIKALEANFGASKAWQAVIDDFAQCAGYGLHLQEEEENNNYHKNDNDPTHNDDTTNVKTGQYQPPFVFPPIKIHISPNDGMVKPVAATWLAHRCYADCEIVSHDDYSSHLPMTLFGGPPRNPILLTEICRDEFGVWNPPK